MFFRVTRTSGREKESGRADGDGLNWQSTGRCKSNGAGHMVVPRVVGATGIAAIVFAFFL